MPKPVVVDERYDFRGGKNSVVSPDLMNANELAEATNARLLGGVSGIVGGFEMRGGTRRMHAAAIGGGAPTAITQWDGPSGKQLVVIGNNGHLFYRDPAAGDFGAFTDVVPATLFSSSQQGMAQFRGAVSGAPLYLYIGDDTVLYRWSGAALTKFTVGVNGIDNAIQLAAYHTRLFAKQTAFQKHLLWSKTGDAETFIASGLLTDAGTAMVGPITGEKIVSLEAIGSSLLIAAPDSIARFTGYSTDDIRIASDTEGVSSEVGAVGGRALKRFETAAAMLSSRGPYVITEAAAQPIGTKVLPDFLTLPKSLLPLSAIVYHKGRKELWFIVSGAGDGGLNKTVYPYSVELQAWSGPFTYPFGIVAATQYQRISDGTDTIVGACNDGFVRDLDTGSLDDVTSAGAGGSGYTAQIEPAVHLFDPGPGVVKALDTMLFDGDLSGACDIQTNIDNAGWTTQQTVASLGAGNVYSYRVDLDGQGKRIRVRFHTAAAPTIIYGYTLQGWNMNRR